jgi:hypothetical protein
MVTAKLSADQTASLLVDGSVDWRAVY